MMPPARVPTNNQTELTRVSNGPMSVDWQTKMNVPKMPVQVSICTIYCIACLIILLKLLTVYLI